MKSRLSALLLLACFLAPAAGAPTADSLAARADSALGDTLARALADSARAGDPAYAWAAWPDLTRAIALRPLDGPEDIAEKVEIIADRLDDLAREGGQLARQSAEWQSRQQSQEIQLEVLDDLAELQRGGDLQLQQRLRAVRGDLRQAAARRRAYDQSRAALAAEVARLQALTTQYLRQADAIRRREEESR